MLWKSVSRSVSNLYLFHFSLQRISKQVITALQFCTCDSELIQNVKNLILILLSLLIYKQFNIVS